MSGETKIFSADAFLRLRFASTLGGRLHAGLRDREFVRQLLWYHRWGPAPWRYLLLAFALLVPAICSR